MKDRHLSSSSPSTSEHVCSKGIVNGTFCLHVIVCSPCALSLAQWGLHWVCYYSNTHPTFSGLTSLSLCHTRTHTHVQCCCAAVYSCNVTWRGANEPREGPWPEACRHLSPALLKCLFITLFQLHLPLSSASRHANPNTPGLSRLIQSMISERREPFPIFFPLLMPKLSHPFLPPSPSVSLCLPKSNAREEENWRERKGKGGREGWMDRRKEGGGRGLLHPAWAAKLVSEQQLDSGDARHTLPTSCVCFCGV